MIKIRKSYYSAVKKYGTTKVLNMYRDGKIELNSKEWKNLHRKIDKENKIYYKWKLNTAIHFIICCLLLILIAPYMDVSNHEKIKKCNEIKGHICSRYEIESVGD